MTSGLGFMSALQRALILEQHQQQQQQQQEEGRGDGDGHGGNGASGGDDERQSGSDEHALELLSTIAACCEVWFQGFVAFRATPVWVMVPCNHGA